MVQTPTRQITLEEFLAVPDTKPASEYIDGEIIQKSMPQGQHSVIQKKLLFAIDPILSDAGIGQAFPELRCTFGGRAIVPDVVVFEEANIAYEENGDIKNVFSMPPDWTICILQRYANEILSPDQSTTKVLKKIDHCLANGTQMGWLIDPADRSVLVLVPNQALQILEAPSTILPVPAFAAAILQGRGSANELTVEKLFSWIKKVPSNSPAQ